MANATRITARWSKYTTHSIHKIPNIANEYSLAPEHIRRASHAQSRVAQNQSTMRFAVTIGPNTHSASSSSAADTTQRNFLDCISCERGGVSGCFR